MDFINAYLKIKPTVAKVLLEKPETRDDDLLLILTIWDIQSFGKLKTYHQFKKNLLKGKLAIPETIRRSRAKLQEENIELRGKNYENRKEIDDLMSKQMKIEF
jgi:hypothetical protein